MPDRPTDPRWPKLLSLSVHEFRTPLTVVGGYIRMLLTDRAGPLSEPQRRLLTEAEKSYARLSALIAEVSELSGFEGGTTSMKRQPVDARAILSESIAQLKPLPDREVTVDLVTADGEWPVNADHKQLRGALIAILAALRRELVTSDRLVVELQMLEFKGRPAVTILIGDDEALEAMRDANPGDLPLFDEWRGGSGLSLPLARRVLDLHDGAIWGAPGDRKAGARIVLPSTP